MKKKTRTLIILAAVLVVCIGAYIGVSMYNTAQAQKTADATKATLIYSNGRGVPVKISYTAGDKTLSFVQDNSTWYVSDNRAFPLAQTSLTGLATVIQNLSAVRTIDAGPDLSVYGLDKPQYTLAASDTGGNTLTLLIGAANSANYYAMVKDSSKIYTIASTLVSDLKPDYLSLITLDTIESLSATNITGIAVSDGKTSLKLDHHQNKDGTYSWFIVSGSTVTLADDYVLAVKSDKSPGKLIDDAVKGLSTAKFSSCAAYQPAADALKTYGLDIPQLTITVDYANTTGAGTLDQKTTKGTVSLEIGVPLSDGSGTYARLPGSSELNVLATDVVTPLTDALKALGAAK